MQRREFIGSLGVAAASLPLSSVMGRIAAAAPRERIRIGQIGTGHAHASGKMATLRKLRDDFEVVGIVEPDPVRREAAARQAAYHDLVWMTEEQLFSIKGLEAVAVETEVFQLVPTAKRCIAAGIHIHLDKPAGDSLREFKSLLADSERRQRIVQMGYMFRGNPAFQFCYQAVREGWLGQIFEIHGVISKTIGDAARERLAEYPGGTMFELGCHLIDAAVAVLGKPEGVTPYIRRTQPTKDSLADNMLAVLEYPAATATIRSALVEVDGFRRRQFVVCGDQGTIEIRPLDGPRLMLTLASAQGKFSKGTHEVELPKIPGRYDEHLLDFARAIRGEKPHEYSPEHDLAVEEAILAASGLPLC